MIGFDVFGANFDKSDQGGRMKALAPRNAVLLILLLTCWAASANAPPGRYAITSDTVLDKRTGLSWQRTGTPLRYSISEAITYCHELDLAGYSDWRLPNMAELLSIVDVTRFNPAIDSNAFPDTPAKLFYSSSPHVGGHCIDFGSGATDICRLIDPAWTIGGYARCVR
jgi:hypothetical protein